jgi:2-polyprenyl-6-methoxyphenol hydroxylase-like FAD-dependent oxidoreductase
MVLSGLNVVVCGAATGGCSAALFLARGGANVTLVERVAQPRAIGAGIAIAENGIAVLEALGLGGIVSAGKPVTGARIVDASGRTLLAPGGKQPYAVMVRRSTLQSMLLDAVASESRITCRFGVDVTGATSTGQVALGSGDSLGADLVVGADGANSRIRECGDFGATVGRGIRYVRMLIPADVATGVEAWTSAGLFGAFAVDGGTYAFASCGTAECRAALEARDLGAFRAGWTRAYAPSAKVLDGIESFDALIQNEVVKVDCARWFDGRLVLVGDAAHAMAPNAGQGANSALVDTAVLYQELSQAANLPDALTAWQRRRRPAVRRVARVSAALGALAEVTHPVPRTLRDRLLVPVLSLFSSQRAVDQLLQESPATLRAIRPSCA